LQASSGGGKSRRAEAGHRRRYVRSRGRSRLSVLAMSISGHDPKRTPPAVQHRGGSKGGRQGICAKLSDKTNASVVASMADNQLQHTGNDMRLIAMTVCAGLAAGYLALGTTVGHAEDIIKDPMLWLTGNHLSRYKYCVANRLYEGHDMKEYCLDWAGRG
jgi:hypothetical protein